MDLKHLKTFVQVAESGSLSKASDKLRLAQPALSRHVKLLEAELGFEVFSRYGRGMHLTEAGQELLQRVSGLVLQIEKSVDDVRSLGTQAKGSVCLGLTPTISYVLSGRLARRVVAELPEVKLRIVEGYGGHLIDWLHKGASDLSLLYGPSADLHLRTTDLLLEELVLVGPKTSGLSPDCPVSTEELARLPLVLPSSPHGLRLLVEHAAARANVRLSVAIEADSFRVLTDLVMAGLGYAVLPVSSISRELASGELTYAPVNNPKITRQIVLALPTSRIATRPTRAVAELVMDEIAVMIASGVWDAFPDEAIRSRGSGQQGPAVALPAS